MKETRGILQTTSQLKSNNCVVVTSSLSWGVGTAVLQHRMAFPSLMAKWRVDKQRDNKEKDVSSPAIVLRIHLCLWWAHFHPTRTTVCWFVCSRRWRRWGGPENKRRPSCTRTMLLLPAGQRSIRPPGPQRGWRCGVNLKGTERWSSIRHFQLSSVAPHSMVYFQQPGPAHMGLSKASVKATRAQPTLQWFHFHLWDYIWKIDHKQLHFDKRLTVNGG